MIFEWKIVFPLKALIISWHVARATDEGNNCFVLKLSENGERQSLCLRLSKQTNGNQLCPPRDTIDGKMSPSQQICLMFSLVEILPGLLLPKKRWGHVRRPALWVSLNPACWNPKGTNEGLKRRFQPVRSHLSLEVVCFTLYKNIPSVQFLHT